MPLFSQQRSRAVRSPSGAVTGNTTATDQILARYRPLETREEGGFGAVEICLDPVLQRRVAIKRIPLAADEGKRPVQSTASAIAEARTASMLPHPNIVTMIDFVHDDCYAYLVMEYVDGMSLAQFLAEVDGHSVTFEEAAAIADALGQALAYAHENRVYHLDIKPANILIDRSGHVKLADFGMAALSRGGAAPESRGGTMGYMPPEQIEEHGVDARTDVFALACVLYESLCGGRPFRATSPRGQISEIERGPVPPSDLLPTLPELSEEVLLAALSADPAGRPAHAAAFSDRFRLQLGSPRRGRKSLSRVIAELTSDDVEVEAEPAEPAWELDHEIGYLGSRWPGARELAYGAAGGLATGLIALAALNVTDGASLPGRIAAASAIGIAAGAAPQLGSSLAITALAATIAVGTPFLGALLPVTLVAAAGAGWWLTWGRGDAAASACAAIVMASGLVPGGDPLAALPAAAMAALLLEPETAASCVVVGMPLARVLSAALAARANLPWDAALGSLADPGLWLATAAVAAAAVGFSLLAVRAGESHAQTGSPLLAALAVAAPLPAGLLISCLAHPMEIAASPLAVLAQGAGAGALSSIIVAICAYTLGYGKASSEGDRT